MRAFLRITPLAVVLMFMADDAPAQQVFPPLKTTVGATSCFPTFQMTFTGGASLSCSGTVATVDLSGVGASTLQEAYDGSNPANITLNGTNGGIHILDSSGGIGVDLFSVRNNADVTEYFSVGSTGINTSGALTVSGNTGLGNSLTADTLTITSSIVGSLTFQKEVAHTISIAASTSAATAGASLVIRAADGNGANGGTLVMDAGNGTAGGGVSIGDTYAASVSLGRSGIITSVADDLQLPDAATGALITGSGDQMLIRSGESSTAKPAILLDTTTTYGASNPIVQFKDNGSAYAYLTTTIFSYSGKAGFDFTTAGRLDIWNADFSGGAIVTPGTDLTGQIGKSDARYSEAWVRTYAGVSQAPSFSATPSWDFDSGETIVVTLTNNITSWTLANGNPSQMGTLVLCQDGGGNRTLAAPPANVTVAGGSLTLTTTGSKCDTVTFRWDNANTRWREIGRAMNQ